MSKSLVASSLGIATAAFLPVLGADANAQQNQGQQLAQVPPPPTAFSWTGFYAGLHAGGIQASTRQQGFVPNTGVDNYCWANLPGCSFKKTDDSNGLVGGLQAGYNHQVGAWVFGAEVDFAGTTAVQSRHRDLNGFDWRSRTGVDALGTARLRAGYTFGGAMVFATGGAVLAHAVAREQIDSGYSWSDRSGWRWGYTGGGGIELAGRGGWSYKFDGLYYLLPDERSHVSAQGVAAYGLKERMSGVIGRLGVNYRF